MCAVECPQQAIELKEKRPEVDKEKCNGCGKCRMLCPVGAISFSLTSIQVIPVKSA
ncbi:hypothetical protein C9J12_07665 [Photobacterium frigidiphilum]|uniref:4Fe-4S ferredoxin-type domain-containing protein n=1 Tax=Photobacterium frigidiphilum TaxID=264736 RepID=A0A2T3JK35_9GAMM|nr:4Fe-4S binding protein [Photobacterium frigidiphilum]PSU49366.1 hypothetical protein C9J12_07665 [Photobacterium frigidiphilum]